MTKYNKDVEMNQESKLMGSRDEISANQNDNKLIYKIDDKPPIHLTLLFAFQQCMLSMFASMTYPLLFANSMCIPNDDQGNKVKAVLAGSVLVGDGVSTFIQTTFGTRLPIMQGSSFGFLVPTLSLMALPHNQCPDPLQANSSLLENVTYENTTMYMDTNGEVTDFNGLWMRRMNELQGGLILAAVCETLAGLSGFVGRLTKMLGPLTITVCITMIGLDLVEVVPNHAQYCWPMTAFVAFVLVMTSQYMINVPIPCLSYNRGSCRVTKFPFFKLFSVLAAIFIGWFLSYILTITDVFPDDPDSIGYMARTDAKINSFQISPWFRVPYPFQFGFPTFTVASFVAVMSGTIASVIESIGDYSACASFCKTPSPPPKHAINRGIMVEGIGCIWTGVLGTGTGTTSFSGNVAAIQITKVASRRVGQVAGVLLVCIGCFTKVGALLFTIPEPVFGGIFIVLFGMIIAVGVANLETVDLKSSRNLFVIGFSFFLGRMIPECIRKGHFSVETGAGQVDQILAVLLGSSLFVGSLVAVVTDNTLPGTLEERGFTLSANNEDSQKYKCYDPPVLANSWIAKYLPIFPKPADRKCNDELKDDYQL